jgi:hypothetical protein
MLVLGLRERTRAGVKSHPQEHVKINPKLTGV